MVIFIHSSKTMRSPTTRHGRLTEPPLLAKAAELGAYLKTLSINDIQKAMHISAALATKTHHLFAQWTTAQDMQAVAIDTFIGDIYSGLRANDFTTDQRAYAQEHLRILSGLYGVIRPLDGICPYRLEMAYKLPTAEYKNLYDFWGDSIASTLPPHGIIVNVSSVEYMQAISPFIDQAEVVTPQFLTRDPKTGTPTFVVVHAKIARGAFARWLIQTQMQDIAGFTEFNDLGYTFNAELSELGKPAFVCDVFGGIGLSVRLT